MEALAKNQLQIPPKHSSFWNLPMFGIFKFLFGTVANPADHMLRQGLLQVQY
jgi:hypothetical protein